MKIKRLIVEMPIEIHENLKIYCSKKNISMKECILELIKDHVPQVEVKIKGK